MVDYKEDEYGVRYSEEGKVEIILTLVKYEEMMNEFDHAYIFISSMSSRQKRDMCACFLKLGYGIREESSISMHVVNLSDDSKFFANISFLVWFFDIMSYISIYKEEKCGELGNRERERTHVKKEFKLKTYRDYSRLSRQTISAIYNRVFGINSIVAINNNIKYV